MTPSRYYVARFAQALGVSRKTQRMSDAASETHLLKEAEGHLGSLIWEKIEPIEELSVEYWNLRKHDKEREIIQKKLADLEAKLELAHQERVTLLNKTPESHEHLMNQRIDQLTKLEALALKRDRIVQEAREVRRAYDGAKMKIEVLTRESSENNDHAEEIKAATERVNELKEKFAELKELRLAIGEKIEEGDDQLSVIDRQINEKKSERRRIAAEAFQGIGDNNKEISIMRSDLGAISNQMHQLYCEIGRYVSQHYGKNQLCDQAADAQSRLITVMRAIRTSIFYNNKLGGLS